MFKNIIKIRNIFFVKILSSLFVWVFAFYIALPPQLFAQNTFNIPNPGLVSLSPGFEPTILKGIKVFADNPLRFDFIVHPSKENPQGKVLESETTQLIKYFLATLTVPDEDLWVNLSPYEKDRIIPNEFGYTEMGRDLLAQDYVLKQLTASLIYPEKELGQQFWNKVYQKSFELYGTTNVPMNTFNKVWIVPEKAVIYENGDTAIILESHLKVMLESDYMALKENLNNRKFGLDQVASNEAQKLNDVSSQIVREIIIPAIEKEVNEGKNFSNLRQIYHSMILATWFKDNLKKNILNRIYVGQNKIAGVDVDDRSVKEKIYEKYLEAFKKGVYNLIKEEYDPATQEIIPRKYFSGGFVATKPVWQKAMQTIDAASLSPAQRFQAEGAVADTVMASVKLDPAQATGGEAQTVENYTTWMLIHNFGNRLFGLAGKLGTVQDTELKALFDSINQQYVVAKEKYIARASDDEMKKEFETLKSQVRKLQERLKSLSSMEQEKLSPLVQKMTNYFSDAQGQETNIYSVIEDMRDFAGWQIDVSLPRVVNVPMNEEDISSVFENLFKNAFEAGASSVRVESRVVGGQVFVDVIDNANGIRKEDWERIFEPNVSFGKEGGTGVGLPSVRQTLQKVGANIKVLESLYKEDGGIATEHHGTTFRLSFPLTEKALKTFSESIKQGQPAKYIPARIPTDENGKLILDGQSLAPVGRGGNNDIFESSGHHSVIRILRDPIFLRNLDQERPKMQAWAEVIKQTGEIGVNPRVLSYGFVQDDFGNQYIYLEVEKIIGEDLEKINRALNNNELNAIERLLALAVYNKVDAFDFFKPENVMLGSKIGGSYEAYLTDVDRIQKLENVSIQQMAQKYLSYLDELVSWSQRFDPQGRIRGFLEEAAGKRDRIEDVIKRTPLMSPREISVSDRAMLSEEDKQNELQRLKIEFVRGTLSDNNLTASIEASQRLFPELNQEDQQRLRWYRVSAILQTLNLDLDTDGPLSAEDLALFQGWFDLTKDDINRLPPKERPPLTEMRRTVQFKLQGKMDRAMVGTETINRLKAEINKRYDVLALEPSSRASRSFMEDIRFRRDVLKGIDMEPILQVIEPLLDLPDINDPQTIKFIQDTLKELETEVIKPLQDQNVSFAKGLPKIEYWTPLVFLTHYSNTRLLPLRSKALSLISRESAAVLLNHLSYHFRSKIDPEDISIATPLIDRILSGELSGDENRLYAFSLMQILMVQVAIEEYPQYVDNLFKAHPDLREKMVQIFEEHSDVFAEPQKYFSTVGEIYGTEVLVKLVTEREYDKTLTLENVMRGEKTLRTISGEGFIESMVLRRQQLDYLKKALGLRVGGAIVIPGQLPSDSQADVSKPSGKPKDAAMRAQDEKFIFYNGAYYIVGEETSITVAGTQVPGTVLHYVDKPGQTVRVSKSSLQDARDVSVDEVNAYVEQRTQDLKRKTETEARRAFVDQFDNKTDEESKKKAGDLWRISQTGDLQAMLKRAGRSYQEFSLFEWLFDFVPAQKLNDAKWMGALSQYGDLAIRAYQSVDRNVLDIFNFAQTDDVWGFVVETVDKISALGQTDVLKKIGDERNEIKLMYLLSGNPVPEIDSQVTIYHGAPLDRIKDIIFRSNGDLIEGSYFSFDREVAEVVYEWHPEEGDIIVLEFSGEDILRSDINFKHGPSLREKELIADKQTPLSMLTIKGKRELTSLLRSDEPEKNAQLAKALGYGSFNELAKAVGLDSAMRAQADQSPGAANRTEKAKYGGIDMNPSMLNIEKRGEGIDVNVPIDPAVLQNVDGFTPVILQIVPITNVPLLLGINTPAFSNPKLSSIK